MPIPRRHRPTDTSSLGPAIGAPGATVDSVAEIIEALGRNERIQAIRTLSGKDQQRLWELADGCRVQLTDMVPADCQPGWMVRHFGRNSLPVFTQFEKRFRLADRGETANTELWGYNFQRLARFTGPGYFVACEDPTTHSIAIDYHRVPAFGTAGWPPLRENTAGVVSSLVYGRMIDHMRKVSEHVTIGRAFKKGKWQPNWFVLCRGSPEPTACLVDLRAAGQTTDCGGTALRGAAWVPSGLVPRPASVGLQRRGHPPGCSHFWPR